MDELDLSLLGRGGAVPVDHRTAAEQRHLLNSRDADIFCAGSTRRVQRTSTPMATTVRPLRVISWRELSEMIPFTRQHILRLEKAGKFPKRFKIGARRVAWLLSEIEAWVAERAALRYIQAPAE